MLKQFTTPALLVIDEIGVQFGSDTEKNIVFEVVNERYESMLPTVLVSNLSLDGLRDYVGRRPRPQLPHVPAGHYGTGCRPSEVARVTATNVNLELERFPR